MGRPDLCCTLQQRLPCGTQVQRARRCHLALFACFFLHPGTRVDLDFLLSLLESMRLMRLSVKKAAYAGVSRAAYRNPG